MSHFNNRFIMFSKPFVEAIKDTFKVMMETEVKIHSPRIKDSSSNCSGQIASIIGMNGIYVKEEDELDFKGLLVLSFPLSVYIKIASKMLQEEYTEYCEDIQDTGAEICNIVMGNSKKVLVMNNYKIDMATPSTVKGDNMEIKYPPKTKVIETIISSELGEFVMEICYQEL